MKTAPVLPNECLWFTYCLVLLFFISLAYVTLLHHEMWRDELQAWLIATGSASMTASPIRMFSSWPDNLGLQLFSIGLLGELIVFTHARDRKDYQIEEIL